jgi:hypothetical protein
MTITPQDSKPGASPVQAERLSVRFSEKQYVQRLDEQMRQDYCGHQNRNQIGKTVRRDRTLVGLIPGPIYFGHVLVRKVRQYAGLPQLFDLHAGRVADSVPFHADLRLTI